MTSEAHRDNINADLAGMFTSHTAQGSITNGGFAFTEPEIRTVIKNWLDLAYSYGESIDEVYAMTSVEGPGLDFASQSFATEANTSGEALTRYLANNRDYCFEQAQLSQNALDNYLGIEHTNVTEINKTDQQGPHSGV
jgi:hypothetical protein